MITRLESGKFRVDERDKSGRRVRASFKTLDEAESYLKVFFANKRRIEKVLPKMLSINEAIGKYAVLVTSSKAARTQVDEKLFFVRMYDFFYREKISDVSTVTKEHLIGLQKNLIEVHRLSPSSVNRYFNTYKNFFECLVEWKYLDENPSRKLDSLEENAKEREVWSDDEIAVVERELISWAVAPFRFLAATARRPGQAADLRFSDFNFEKGIYRTITRKGKGRAMEQFFPITESVAKIFEEQKADREKNPVIGLNADLVFLSAKNLRLNSQTLAREVRRACEESKVSNRVTYGLRHTVLTHASAINLDHARRIGGHTSIKTTQRYLHANTQDISRTLEVVNKKGVQIG